MAADHSSLTRGGGNAAKRSALPASAGDALAVLTPSWAREVMLQLVESDETTDAAGSVAYDGVDGDSIGDDVTRIAAGQAVVLRIAGGCTLYVAGPAGGYVHATYGARVTA
jgi:polygalacturonase